MSFRKLFARRGQRTSPKRIPNRQSRASRLAVESLESRRMLAITVMNNMGVLTFTGDAAADALNLQLNGSNVNYSGTGLAAGSANMVTSISYDGGGGANSVSIADLAGGSTFTMVGGNITYNSGGTIGISLNPNVATVGVFDNSVNGGDEIALQSTLAAVTTTVGSQSGAGGDEIDISSDAPNDAGNLAGILGVVNVSTGSGTNGVFIGNAGGAAAPNVAISTTQITGFAPATINIAASPFINAQQQLFLIGSNGAATTFNVNSTFGLPNTLTLVGGTAGNNIFNIKGTSANNLTVITGSGNGNVVNMSSNAPTNTGNLTGIIGPVTVDSGVGHNTLNISNIAGTTAASMNMTNAQITGLTPQAISYAESTGGALDINVSGSNTQPTTFSVASTLGTGNTVTLTGGTGGNNIFNLQGASADTVRMVVASGSGNVFNISSDAPANLGNTAGIGATTNVIVSSGTGANTLNVSDLGGTTTRTVTLSGTQIRGYSTLPIAYSEGAGGTLAMNLTGENTVGTTFIVTGTLPGAGDLVTLNGGAAGSNVFNIRANTCPLIVNTGVGNGNTVNISSDAPTNHGNLTGIAALVTVNSDIGSNSLVVSNFGGAGDVTLTNAQISGWTATPIAYNEAAGGTLAITLVGPNAVANTKFNVLSTLGAGNTVSLVGGLAGGNTFNIGSSAALNNGQLSLIGAAVTVNGGLGPNNTLEVNDHGTTGAFNYLVNSTSVLSDPTTPRPFGGVTYSNVQTLQLDATEQQNEFTVAPSTIATYTINAYAPTATGLPGGNVPPGQGDELVIDFSGTQGAQLTKVAVPAGGNSFNGNWSFTNRKTVNFTSIEQLPIPIVVTATDASKSGPSLVQVFFAGSNQILFQFSPFGPNYHNGVHVALGYFDGTGQQDIAVSPGTATAGVGPIVKVYSPDITQPTITHLFDFQAYPTSMKSGINIAAGNVENQFVGINPLDDIVTVPVRGVSEVRVWHNQFIAAPFAPVTLFRDFRVWSPSFIGGSTVAVADLNADSRGDVIVGSGPGMQALIEAFDVTVPAASYAPFKIFYPFDISFRGGVNVSAVNSGLGAPNPVVVASQGNGGTSLVRVFNGTTGALSNTFIPFTGFGSNSTVRAVPKIIGGKLFVLAAQGTDGRSHAVRSFDPIAGTVVDYILENDPAFVGFFLG